MAGDAAERPDPAGADAARPDAARPDAARPDAARSDTKRNRRQILDAALQLLLSQGHATVEDVARTAGLTRATVYRHFPHRDALFRAAMTDVADTVIKALLESMHDLPLGEALDELARQVVQAAVGFAALLASSEMSLQELADVAVPGDPIVAELAGRRAAGEITVALTDQWLATCTRALILAAIRQVVQRGEAADDATRALAHTLRRLVAGS